jgi:hypothetical protein
LPAEAPVEAEPELLELLLPPHAVSAMARPATTAAPRIMRPINAPIRHVECGGRRGTRPGRSASGPFRQKDASGRSPRARDDAVSAPPPFVIMAGALAHCMAIGRIQ